MYELFCYFPFLIIVGIISTLAYSQEMAKHKREIKEMIGEIGGTEISISQRWFSFSDSTKFDVEFIDNNGVHQNGFVAEAEYRFWATRSEKIYWNKPLSSS